MTQPGATRHLGLDLGATNLKWAVVEQSADDWRTVATNQVPTRVVPDLEAVPTAVVAQLADVACAVLAANGPIVSIGIGVRPIRATYLP